MSQIRVVDARMGRGKTSAAAGYMSHLKGKKHFIFITPYLTEVDRICELCKFDQPDGDHTTKLNALKALMYKKKDIASTHSLFYLMDEEALRLAKDNGYSIIIDESIEPVQRMQVTSKDFDLLVNTLTEEAEDGSLHWVDPTYTGKFDEYKEIADADSLFRLDSSLLSVMRPQLIEAFDEVIMMTYLFGGQYQKAYLDYFGFEYSICGIDDTNGYTFTDKPDEPPPLDYKRLINIVDDEKMNSIGDQKYSLSKNWYGRRDRDHKDIKTLRNLLNTYFRRKCSSKSTEQLWTCFKSDAHKLYGSQNRFASSFLQLSARATNEYRARTDIAYLVNRFTDPNIIKFFSQKGIELDEDEFALAEMLQFIWRGAIRDNKAINLYIPSKRMRTLLTDWIERVSKGVDINE